MARLSRKHLDADGKASVERSAEENAAAAFDLGDLDVGGAGGKLEAVLQTVIASLVNNEKARSNNIQVRLCSPYCVRRVVLTPHLLPTVGDVSSSGERACRPSTNSLGG